MQFKRIVILANSRKHSGRCLAGREIVGPQWGGWMRPVSNRSGEEISEWERQYNDGSFPEVLDVVDVPVQAHKPHGFQIENWLISPNDYWIKVGTASWDQVQGLAENHTTLWINGDSTYSGLNDQISQQRAATLTSSICMIHVDSVEIHVLVPGAAFGDMKRRVQARFVHNGVRYWLWVTDPRIERQYLAGSESAVHLGECLLTISVSEPHAKNDGSVYHYKLVATIIQR